MMDDLEPEDGEMLDYYIQLGAIEVAGISEDGEFIFGITELAREVAPDLWEAHANHVDQSMMQLYEMGLVNITYDENLNATFELTEEGKKVSKDFGIIEIDNPDIPNN
jgi:predicted transcriptional regulator